MVSICGTGSADNVCGNYGNYILGFIRNSSSGGSKYHEERIRGGYEMIILTNNQMRDMARNICEQQDGNLVMAFDGNEIEVKYYLDYIESFESETGASNIDNVDFSIDEVTSFDEEIYFDEQRLGNMVIDYLTA